MIGAIVGDVVGSVYEFHNIRTKNFTLLTEKNTFTDDTIMTIAIMDWLLKDKNGSPVRFLQKWGRKYPSSYGNRFYLWLWENNPMPYDSFGNGSAMRISPIAYAAKNEQELYDLTIRATEISHNHPEGIKGALVTSTCVYMALHGKTKKEIQEYAISQYPEIKTFTYKSLRKNYGFNESCQESVPQAIYCFLISKDFEDCLRTTVSIGGDCDTTSAISCAVADAYYGVPNKILNKTLGYLTYEMRTVVYDFTSRYQD